MFNFNKEKTKFLDSIAVECARDPKVSSAVSLGVDFLMKSHTYERDIPIVLCSYSAEQHQATAAFLARFCRQIRPSLKDEDPYLIPNMLRLSGETTQQSLVQYCNHLKDYGSTLFYWADHISWIKNMPPEMFYAIDFNGPSVVGGFNRGMGDAQAEDISDVDERDDSDIAPDNLTGLINMAIQAEDIHTHFYHEADAGIIRIITAPEGESFDSVITAQSPEWQREACVAIRRYLGRECGYGMQWDSSAKGWEGVEVYPFLASSVPVLDKNTISQGIIGFALFSDDHGAGEYYLSSVWIHPFYRRKNLLGRAWPNFVARYGKFPVEAPNTNMKAFLKRIGHKGEVIGDVDDLE